MDDLHPMAEEPPVAPPGPADEAEADAGEAAVTPVGPPVPAPRRRTGLLIGFSVFTAVALVAVLVLQVYLIRSLDDTSEKVADADTAIEALTADVEAVQGSVETIEAKVDEIDVAAAQQSSSGPVGSPGAPIADGSLPRFIQGQADQALGLRLGEVNGPEFYSGEAAAIDPADGTMRVWLIWAHWCPYCQEEMPGISEWWGENAGLFPNSDFVTVTTSIDPSRGNPLEPYLEELQLPLPTFVDADLALAQQFGVSAFPFWVVTDGTGTVLFRTAGLLGVERVTGLFTQLEDLATAQ